jgi:hypothetical protein
METLSTFLRVCSENLMRWSTYGVFETLMNLFSEKLTTQLSADNDQGPMKIEQHTKSTDFNTIQSTSGDV